MPQLQLLAAPPAHSEPAWQVAFNPKRNILASCSTDRTIRFYSFSLPGSTPDSASAPGSTAPAHQHGPGCSHGHPHGDGHDHPAADAGASGDDDDAQPFPLPSAGSPAPSVTLLSSVLTEHKRTVRSLAWSPSGQTLATGSFDSTVALWAEVDPDEAERERVAEEEGGEGVYRPTGAGAGGRVPADEDDDDDSMSGDVGKRDKEWECVTTLEGHESECKTVAWSADGALLASCSRDKSVWVWEIQPDSDFECIAVLMEHSQDVKNLAWHPHEEILASASYDSHINLQWDDPDGDWCTFQKLHPKLPMTSLSIPDPSAPVPVQEASVPDADSTQPNGTEAAPAPAHTPVPAKPVSAGAIASFNALAAALMPTPEEQEAAAHLEVPPLLEDETVWSLVFSPCGRYFASGGDLGGIRLWARTGHNPDSPFVEVLHTAAHARSVFSLSWTAAGLSASEGGLGLLASAGGDGKIIVLQVYTPMASTDAALGAGPEEKGARRDVGARPIAAARDAHGVADVNCVTWLERPGGVGRGVLASCADDGSVKVWRVVDDE